MKRVFPSLFAVLALLMAATGAYALPISAAVSGVVRDAHGTPQMGALVELVKADASTVASTLTDDHGRYILPSVVPGKYELRASAAFFVPTTHSNLRLRAGAQAIINFTMSTLFDAGNWLPVERRGVSEPTDDWKWTLRSTANRPLLRLVDPESGELMSTSAAESHKRAAQARLTVTNDDGTFGHGGTHQVLTMDRVEEDGDGAIFRTDLGDPQLPLTVAPSADVTVGYQHSVLFGGRTRMIAGFSSHPELIQNGMPGFQCFRMASTQEIPLGDAVMIDVGTLLEAEKLASSRIISEPYLRLNIQPSGDWAIQYRYATGRSLQSADDLDQMRPQLTPLTDQLGRPLSDKGSHHELRLSRRLGKDSASVAVYRDSIQNAALMGSGAVNGVMMQAAPVIADPTTSTFRLAAAGYKGRGAVVSYTHALTPALSATAKYELGTALRAGQLGASVTSLATRGHTASAASVAIRGHIQRTGTSVSGEYRWQPVSTLTQIDAYNATPDEAFLSFVIRQKIWGGKYLPHGVDAVVMATNLLEQGYTPVLAPDGRTLFLAQVPRALEAGVSFNF
ncbi:MAG: carboxypeptidase-like regulatory domain-containing protein [Acidobacteriaceae bacterium]|nr:carboxypeptidase-like regulatory domain-containing protein [Acidobacteriaceae bacterium]